MGRPKGSKNRKTLDREAAGIKLPDPGTKACVLAQLERQLSTQPATSVGKAFEDKGRKIDVQAYMALRAQSTLFPTTPDEVYESFLALLSFCKANRVVPTQGMFALWNGVTMQRVWQIENDTSDPRSRAIGVCKESIRQFIEQGTLEGSVNPLLYFNQMKSQFNLPETQAVTIRTEDNAQELDDDEYRQRVELVQQADGSYGEG